MKPLSSAKHAAQGAELGQRPAGQIVLLCAANNTRVRHATIVVGTVPTALTLLSAIPVASTSPSASTRPVASTAAAHALSTAEARVLAASLREPFLKLAQFRVPIELTF